MLAQQAAQMIGTYIAIGIARAFAGMGGGESATLRQVLVKDLLQVLQTVSNVLGSLGRAEAVTSKLLALLLVKVAV